MMKEFKGTKGPWETFNDDGELKVIQSGSMEQGRGWRSYSPICGEVSMEDDADLIAAAPDLLEELQLTLGALREICFTCGAARPESTIRRAETAIAKALGEAK